MIAIPERPNANDLLAVLVRRLLGGRALVMSEYAKRLVDAIAGILPLVNGYGRSSPWTREQFNEVVELDGRIEALRIRLGIDALPVHEWNVPDKGFDGPFDERNATIGFTRIGICEWSDYREFEHAIFPAADDDWRYRMNSLKAMAQELAIAPELDPEEEAIVGLIVATGRRLTTTQILDEFSKGGTIKAESTVKLKLSQLTKRKVLVNRSDTNPKGYGLPEWV